jgi:F0F1-type ATP synthase membrane subunit b/b'
MELTKTEHRNLQTLRDRITGARGGLQDKIDQYNEAVETAWSVFEDAIAVYKEALSEARDAVEGDAAEYAEDIDAAAQLAAALHEKYEDRAARKSESWRESDEGQTADQMIEALAELSAIEAPEISFVEEAETSEPELPSSDLEDLGERFDDVLDI